MKNWEYGTKRTKETEIKEPNGKKRQKVKRDCDKRDKKKVTKETWNSSIQLALLCIAISYKSWKLI